MTLDRQVAKALLELGAVGFKPTQPLTFKSGIISPVYVDNRIFPAHPTQWQVVIKGFKKLIEEKNLQFDAIAGIETAGIPHSAALGYMLKKPSVFIRKKPKDHGTKKLVEGGEVKGKKVILLEDLVTTGGSSLHGVDVLREAKAKVSDCLVIISYGFVDSRKAFAQARVKLHSLTTFPIVLEEAYKLGKFNQAEKTMIEEWFKDPWGWGKKYGFSK